MSTRVRQALARISKDALGRLTRCRVCRGRGRKYTGRARCWWWICRRCDGTGRPAVVVLPPPIVVGAHSVQHAEFRRDPARWVREARDGAHVRVMDGDRLVMVIA